MLVVGDEGDHQPGGPGAAGAARPVDVVLGVVGQVEVDDAGHAVDMDAAGGHVGGHEDRGPPGAELAQGLVALGLGPAAVDRHGLDAGLAELAGHPVGTVAGAGEHDRGPGAGDDVGHERDPLGPGHGPEHVLDLRGVGLDVRGGVVGGVGLVVADQLVDVAVERRREQQGLAAVRGQVEQAADRGEEPHVGHAVGLVEHDDLGAVEDDVPGGHEVLQAAGAGHDDARALGQHLALGAVADTAVERGHGTVAALVDEGGQLALDLGGQLAGRDEDQRPGAAGPRRTGGRGTGGDDEPEDERLAGPGGRLAGHVAPGEGVGQRGGLDGERFVDAAAGQGGAQGRGHAESGERGGHETPIEMRAGRFDTESRTGPVGRGADR